MPKVQMRMCTEPVGCSTSSMNRFRVAISSPPVPVSCQQKMAPPVSGVCAVKDEYGGAAQIKMGQLGTVEREQMTQDGLSRARTLETLAGGRGGSV